MLVYDVVLNIFKEESFSEIHKQQTEIFKIIEEFLKEKQINV